MGINDFFSIGVFGGLIMLVGAWNVYKGNIFRSLFAYIVADICWVLIAYNAGDAIGALFILVGITISTLAYIKMNAGIMRKTLDW